MIFSELLTYLFDFAALTKRKIKVADQDGFNPKVEVDLDEFYSIFEHVDEMIEQMNVGGSTVSNAPPAETALPNALGSS